MKEKHPGTIWREEYLEALGEPIPHGGGRMDWDAADDAIHRILCVVNRGLKGTFRNVESVVPQGISMSYNDMQGAKWDRSLRLAGAVRHSPIFEQLLQGAELTPELHRAVVDIAHRSLEGNFFARLNCRSPEIKAYKDSLPVAPPSRSPTRSPSAPAPHKSGCFGMIAGVGVLAVALYFVL